MKRLYIQLFVAAFAVVTLLAASVSAADPAPVVTSVSPSTASNTGGDSVTITGSGFTPESTVSFGFFQALSVSYIDANTLQAVVPVSDEFGGVDVSVKNSDGQMGVLAHGLMLTQAAPSLTSLVPSSGPTVGGTSVVANGAGFYSRIRFSHIDAHSSGTHACGIAAGKVYCWGNNNRGQLGDGTLVSRSAPVPVDDSGLLKGRQVVALAAGFEHTLALTADGMLLAWGYNNNGQLGDGTLVDALTPVAVDMSGALSGKTIDKIAAGSYFSLVLTADGKLFAWGLNSDGQLGDGTTTRRTAAVAVVDTGALAGKTITAIAAGVSSSHVIDSDGKAYGWGYNKEGRIGDGTATSRSTPVAVVATGVLSGKRLVAIDTGYDHTVALDSDGMAYGWGYGTSGQLGQGLLSTSYTPIAALASSGALSGKRLVAISASAYSTMALDSDGALYAWGQNNYGQMATVTTSSGPNPRLVGTVGAADRPPITSIVMGAHSGYATTSDGDSYSWGYNYSGQLATGDTTSQQQLVKMIDEIPRTLGVEVDGVTSDVIDGAKNTLTFKTPAHTPGLVDISFTENGAPVTTLTNAFEYIAAPAITSVSPGVASNVGGDSVTITGSGFTPESTVSFGFLPALSVSYIDSNTLQAVVPASDESGTITVTVKNADGQSDALVPGLTLTRANPSLSGLAPSKGPTAGGTAVTVNGSGFYGGVRFSLIEANPSTNHVCGIAAGRVYCWGVNSSGQLGDGTTTSSYVPVAVNSSGVLKDKHIVDLAIGNSFTLAASSDGEVFAWGLNSSGQFGDGTTVSSSLPVATNMNGALSGKKIVSLDAGANFVLALSSDGVAYAWGDNSQGQLGIGSTTRQLSPVAVYTAGVLAGKRMTYISAGWTTSHALDSDGKAYGWGSNGIGMIGDNSGSQQTLPVAVISSGVLSGKRLVMIEGGQYHTVALDSNGAAYAWGYNGNGQLGTGNLNQQFAPALVKSNTATSGKVFEKIAAGAQHTVAVTADGALFSWGQNNFNQLGNSGISTTGYTSEPVLINPNGNLVGKGVISLASGPNSNYAATSSGESYAWGQNNNGQLGTGNTTQQVQLTKIIGQTPRTLSVRIGGSEVPITDQTATSLSFTTPAQPAGLVDVEVVEDSQVVASLAEAFEYVAPPTVTNVAPASASNSGGDVLIISGADFMPGARVQIGLRTLSDVTFINTSTLQVAVPASDQVGGVDVTVINSDGQKATLKNGFTYVGVQRPTATGLSPTVGPVKGGQSVAVDGAGFMQNVAFTKVSAAGNHACGISNGTAYCWGDNASGQLGDGTKNRQLGPVAVGVPGILAGKTLVAIDTGTTHTVAVDASGQAYAWGDNSHGQLGDGTLIQRLTPVAVDTSGVLQDKTIVDVSVGVNHTAVVDSEGKVYSWGNNGNGQLGNNTTANSSVPVAVSTSGALTGKVIRSISMGVGFSMALDAEGRVYGWGSNSQGQLGINSKVNSQVPVAMYVDGAVGGRAIQAIAAGEGSHAVVLDVEGRVYGMGYNAFGQVGNNSTTAPQVPTPVYSIGAFVGKKIVSIAVGEYHSIALDSEGKLYSWGNNNTGQFGDGTMTSVRYPVPAVSGGSVTGKEIIEMAGGKNHSLFIDTGGKIHGTGANSAGQLGTGATTTVSTPQAAATQTAMPLEVLFGGAPGTITHQTESLITVTTPPHSAGVVDVTVSPYGASQSTLSQAYTYLEPPRITSVTPASGAVAGGDLLTVMGTDITPGAYVLIDDTRVDATFINSSTLTFAVPASLTPGKVNIRVVNIDGQSATLPLGYEYQSTPPVITGVSPDSGPTSGGNVVSVTGANLTEEAHFAMVAAGPTSASSYGLTEAGSVYAWGINTDYSLGDGSQTQQKAPVRVGLSGPMAGKTIKKIASGHLFGLALDMDGVIYGWGYNGSGQLGNGSATRAQSPVLVDVTGALAGKKIVDISAGNGYSLALDEDGVVYSWGVSSNGQLGNGSTLSQGRPGLVDASGVLAGKKIVKIFAGYDHAFAVDDQGALYGWGANTLYSLGDGTTTRRLSPVALSATGVLAGVRFETLAAGQESTIAVSRDGRVFAWGRNSVGQLGNGSTSTVTSPVEITNSGALAGKRIVAVSLNGETSTAHAIARDDEGGLYGWGYNQYGGIGNGEAASTSPYAVTLPVRSDTNIPMKDVSAGSGYSCGISYTGIYYCWGRNSNGQLGDGTTTNRLNIRPVDRANLTREAPFNLIDAGGAQATISNATSTSFSFVAPPHEAGVVDLSIMNRGSSLSTLPDAYEYLAPPAISSVAPTTGSLSGGDVVTVSGADFAPGAYVMLDNTRVDATFINSSTLSFSAPATLTPGKVNVRVVNADGQYAVAARGYEYLVAAPMVSGVSPASGPAAGGNVVTVSGGGFTGEARFVSGAVGAQGATAFGVTSGGTVYAWGYGYDGMLGTGRTTNEKSPVKVSQAGVLAGKRIQKVAAGINHALALDAEGRVYGWGVNRYGQIGDGTNTGRTSPVATSVNGALAGKRIVDIAAGGEYSLALDEDGVVYSWGYNSNAALGDGGTTTRYTPGYVSATGVLAGKKITKIAAGYSNAFAIDEQGVLYGWGENDSGSLGDSTATRRTTPIVVSTHGALAGVAVKQVSPGRQSTLAVGENGRLYSWGINNRSQLGDGTTTTTRVPIDVSDAGALAGKNIVDASLSGDTYTSAMALDDEGVVYGWGYNQMGGLGLGYSSVTSPFTVSTPTRLDLKMPMDKVMVSEWYSCAISSSGVYYCAGYNGSGEAGDGTGVSRPTMEPIARTSFSSDAVFSALQVDGRSVELTELSATSIKFIAPAHEPGVVDISLISDQYASVTAGSYEYMAPPQISSVSPAQGVKTGGDTITITGSNFDSNPTVTIGGVAATSVNRLSSTTITASTPASAVGVKDVVVVNGDGQQVVLSQGFTYTEPSPVLSSITPANGPVAGGQEITLRGDNFVEGPSGQLPVVTVGGLVATDVAVVSATELRAKTPAGTPGVYDVTVTNYDGKTSTLAGAYEYLTPPTITGVTPSQGSVRGGDVVTITGANIHEGATVKFGSVDAVQVVWLSDTSLLATAPAHYVGPKGVTIINPDGQPATLRAAYEYRGIPPTITSVTPSAGTMSGGQTVTITGEGFESRRQRPLTVINATDAPILDANIMVQFDTASLIAAGKMRADGGDIRISDASGGVLPYYLEVGINTADTIIWAALDTLPVGETTLYLSYGTPEMESESDETILRGEPSVTPVTFRLDDELRVSYPGPNATACKEWHVPGGGRAISVIVSHQAENYYDKYSISGDGIQYYSAAGAATGVSVAITSPSRTLTACMSTDGSVASDAGWVTSVEAYVNAGTVVATVGGESFASTVLFGDQAATITQISGTSVTATTPSHAPGAVDVSISSAYSDPVIAQDAYTFLPAGYAFTNAPLSVASREAGELWIELRNADGEPVISTNDVVLELGTSSDAGAFADSVSSETWDKATLTVPAGQSRAKVYYRDNLQGSPTLTVTDIAGTTASQQQNIGPRYKLLVTGVSDPVRAGVPSSVTIQAVDVDGNPLSDYTGTVTFTSSDPNAKLPRNQTLTTDNRGRYTFVNGVTMMSQGEQCVTVTDVSFETITGSQCDITTLAPGEGTPSKLAIITPAQSFSLSDSSAPITIQAQDINGDAAITIADTPIYLHSSSSTGQFSVDGVSWVNAPLQTAIQSGTSSVNVYYRDLTAGEHTLTARDEEGVGADIGWSNAEQMITVGVGAASKFKISGESQITAGVWTAVQVGLGDVSDNSVSAKQDVIFELTGDSSSARFSRYADGSDATATLSGVITTGAQYMTVYVFDTVNHPLTLQASDSSPPSVFDAGEMTVLVESSAPVRAAMMPIADTKIYEAVPVYGYLQDEFGNTVLPEAATDVSFTSSRTSGGFAAVATGAWEQSVTQTIPVGQPTTQVYYRDTKSGVATITIASAGVLDGSANATILPQDYDPADGGKLILSAPVSVTTDDESTVTVTLQDKYGETAVASGPTTIRLTLTSGEYSADGTTWLSTVNVVVPAGESSASVKYRNYTASTATLYAQDVAVGFASRVQATLRIEAGEPAQLVFTNDALAVAKSGVTEPLVVQLKDAQGNDTVARSALNVSIGSSSASGEFSLDGLEDWAADMTLVFAEGASSRNIYYRDATVGNPAITAASAGLVSATQNIRVVEGFVDQLRITTSVSAGAGEVVPIIVSSHMQSGEEVAVIRDTTIQLRGDGQFSLTETPFTPISSLTLVDGESRAELYYRSESAGLKTLRAYTQTENWDEGLAEIAIAPGEFYGFNFTVAPATTPVTEASDEFVISAADMFGNVTLVESQTPVYLYTDSNTGSFAASPDSWGDTSLDIAASTSSQSFRYKDTTLGRDVELTASDSATLDVPDTGAQNAVTAVRVVGQRAEKLEFVTQSQTVTAGEFSSIITVEARTNDGSPAIQGAPLSVWLSGATGDQFSTSRDDISLVSAVTIPVGESRVSFYVKPAKAGERSLTATSGGVVGSQTITVVAAAPAKLEFTSAQQSIVAGEASGQITVELRDASDNTTTSTGDTAIELTSSCTTGEFSLASGANWASIQSITVPAGQSSALFYYRATTTGWCTLTAGGALEAAEQGIYIRGAEGVKLQLDAPQDIAKGQPVTVTASLRDTFGNIVTNSGSYRQLYFASTSSEGVFNSTTRYLSPGSSSVTVTYTDFRVGSTTVSVKDQAGDTDTGWSDASLVREISRGQASSLAFTEPTFNTTAGESRKLRIELRNQYGATYSADTDTIVHLASSAQDGYFTAGAGLGREAASSSVTIAQGQSSIDVYYVQDSATTAELRASVSADGVSTGITNGTANVSVSSAAIDGLHIVSAPQTAEVNEPRALTVEARDRFGNATVFASDTILYLHSSSQTGSFMASQNASPIASVIVPAGSTSMTVYYKDQSVGSATLTISDRPYANEPAGIDNATQQATTIAPTPGKIVFVDAPGVLERGQVGVMSVEVRSRFDVPVAAEGDRTIYLTDRSGEGAFAETVNGPWGQTQLTIRDGESRADFYYRNLVSVGNIQLQASDVSSPAESPDSGLINAAATIEMQKGDFAQVRFETAPLIQTAKHPSSQVVVKAYNRYGVETSVAGQTALYLRSTHTGAEFSADGSNWGVNRVMLNPSASASSASFYYRDPLAGTPTLTVSTKQTTDPTAISATQEATILLQVHAGFLVTNVADPQHLGTPSSLVVAAVDSEGYVIDWYSGTIMIGSSDGEAVVPGSYTFDPQRDKGIHTFTNGVAFTSVGEKTISVSDIDGKTGEQTDITVLGSVATELEQLSFIEPKSAYQTVADQVSPLMTIQAQDADGNAYAAGVGGLPVRLSSTNQNGQFATSPNGPWQSTLIATIPRGLSYVNVYYRDSDGRRATLTASDWSGNNDDATIRNATFEVLGKDDEPPVDEPKTDAPNVPGVTDPSTPSDSDPGIGQDPGVGDDPQSVIVPGENPGSGTTTGSGGPRGRAPIVAVSATPSALESILPQQVIEVLRSPATQFVFPVLLFALILFVVVLLLRQIYRELKHAREVRAVLDKEAQTAHEKTEFMTIAAHYLRTPITIISSAAGLLARTGTEQTLAERIMQVTQSLTQKSEIILAETESAALPSVLSDTQSRIAKTAVYRSPLFWLPVALTIGLTLLVNWAINEVGGQVGAVAYLEQVALVGLAMLLLYIVLRERYMAAARREMLEAESAHRESLDKAKNEFVTKTYEQLSVDVAQLVALKNELDLNQPVARALEDGSRRLLTLVAKFQTLSRIDTLQVNPSIFDTEDLMKRATDSLQEAAMAKRIALSSGVPLAQLQQDERLVASVLNSVIANAIDYSPEGGQVSVAATQDKGDMIFTIEDQGPGFSRNPEELMRPFERGESAESVEHEGVGLSLYLDKIIMRHLGGEIQAANGDKSGARVTIRVPLTVR